VPFPPRPRSWRYPKKNTRVTSQPKPRNNKMIRTTFDIITKKLKPNILLVQISSEIDIANTDFAAKTIRAAVAPPTQLVLIDLSTITFCHSAGLGNLVETRNLAGRHNITLTLVGVGRPVDRPLTITGLGGQFRIFASVTKALQQL